MSGYQSNHPLASILLARGAVIGLVVFGLLAASCSDDDAPSATDEPTAATTETDRAGRLNDLGTVVDTLGFSSEIDTDLITDVSYETSTDTAVLTVDGLDEGDADSFCDNVVETIALADLKVRIVDGQDAELASCGPIR